MKFKRLIAVISVLAMVLTCFVGCGSSNGSDTSWPEKDITIDVAYAAGGTADTCARALAVEMGDYLGVNISVQNVEGGSGSICGQQVLDSGADGYTWMGCVAHTPSGWRTMGYSDTSWENFFGFYAGTSPYVLFVNKNSEYKTCDDLFKAMKANPDMKWGNAGLGSINQLTGQLMMDQMGLKGNSLPFDGGREAANKVMAGEVVWSWAGLSDVMDLAISGDIQVLGVCSSEPMTIDCANGAYEAEALVKEYPELADLEDLLYWGIAVPRDTDPEIIAKIKEAFDYAIEQDSFKEYCANNALTPVSLTGTESDEKCAMLESIYAWGLYDLEIGTVSPEETNIPRIEDFTFPANDLQKDANPWP